MKKIIGRSLLITSLLISTACYQAKDKTAPSETYEPKIMHGFLGEAMRNGDWKDAIATAKHAQIVFMEVSEETNPKNEIGMEVHPFDQMIYIVEGWGRAILGKKTEMVQSGDMILVPQGTRHNIVNLNHQSPLKLISIYTDRDMPKDAVYRTKEAETTHSK